MRVWTEEQKQKQRDAIRAWAPWKRSTGPKTPEGKAISSQNAYKHGVYSVAGRRVTTFLYHQRLYLRQVELWIKSWKLHRKEEKKNRTMQNELLNSKGETGTLLSQFPFVGGLSPPQAPPTFVF